MSLSTSSNADPDTGGPMPAPGTRRADALPLWVAVVLGLFLVLRLYDVGVVPFLHRAAPAKAAATSGSGDMDADSMQDLVQTDIAAKTAFAQTLARPGASVGPDAKALRPALRSADDLQRESGNSPGAARRVLLLRALLAAAAPGSGVLPPLAVGKNGLAPIDAFGKSLPHDLPAADRARYAAEARLWQTVFQGGRLSPARTAAAAAQVRALPGLHWWQGPALSVLYAQQGDQAQAARYARQARDSALPSLLPLGALSLVRLGFILLGLALLVYFVVRWVQKGQPPTSGAAPPAPNPVAGREAGRLASSPLDGGSSTWPPAPPLPTVAGAASSPTGGAASNTGMGDLWPTVPDTVPPAQRRLRAGDLFGVFAVYLLGREVLGLLLAGFPGVGAAHLLHFAGLIAPFRPALDRMSATDRTTAGIVLESAAYLLSAVPPFALLWAMARRRGASLADEIGWTRRALGTNLLYGAGGFAVASALMIPVILIGRVVFRHAPDPSNPVIPQIIGAGGLWGPLLLVLLASFGAPVVEELLFRGVFYQAAKLRVGVWPAIVLTGLVFGFVHPVGVAEMLAIGTLGGVFAWMAETRKSLAPSMFAHFLQNFTTTLLLLSVISG